jgi:hypothetical protein
MLKGFIRFPITAGFYVLKSAVCRRNVSIFLALKFLNSEKFYLSKELTHELSRFTGIGKGTIKKGITSLVDMNWLGKKPNENVYYIRKWTTISSILKTKFGISSPELYGEFDIRDLKNLEAFVGGLLIAYKFKQDRYLIRRDKGKSEATVRTKGRAYQVDSLVEGKTFVSYSYFAKMVGIHERKAGRILCDACDHGFVEKECRVFEMELDISGKEEYRVANAHLNNRLVSINSKPHLREACMYRSTEGIRFKKCPK